MSLTGKMEEYTEVLFTKERSIIMDASNLVMVGSIEELISTTKSTALAFLSGLTAVNM